MKVLLINIALIFENNTSSANDTAFYWEIGILLFIAVIQLYRSIEVYFNIEELKNIFKDQLFIKNGFIEKDKLGKIEINSDEIQYDNSNEESLEEITGDDIIKLSLVDTKAKSLIINKIKNTINTYLINNYGAAVNFSIIKDIVDREVDIKDEEISQTITVPLYLGLVATMIGIILGLWSMPDLNANSTEVANSTNTIVQNIEESTNFNSGINALIRGVQWAMGASLLGLFCTTILSTTFYKNAKTKTLKEKNDQLSYLQAKLLPELIKAEDTGVSGLKASLDKFARVGTLITDNVLKASNQTGKNLELQQNVMDKIENMEVLKVSKASLEIFDKLNNNMDAYAKFSKYLSKMENITSNLLEFSKRTSNIDLVIQQIDFNLKESKKLSQFLTAHFEEIKTSGSAALKAVGIAESHFEESIITLKTRTDDMIEQLYKSSGNHENKLEEIYKEINNNLNSITSQYLTLFSNAYSNSMPKFEQLENLSLLPEIKSENNTNSLVLLENVKELNNSLKSLQNSFSKINVHSVINENISGGQVSLKSSGQQTELDLSETKTNSTVREKKPLGLGSVLKKLLSK